jgi:hypothetical protein
MPIGAEPLALWQVERSASVTVRVAIDVQYTTYKQDGDAGRCIDAVGGDADHTPVVGGPGDEREPERRRVGQAHRIARVVSDTSGPPTPDRAATSGTPWRRTVPRWPGTP